MTDAQVWWGWFCIGVAAVFLILVAVATRHGKAPMCVVRGHKFTFMLGDYQYPASYCRRCGFRP